MRRSRAAGGFFYTLFLFHTFLPSIGFFILSHPTKCPSVKTPFWYYNYSTLRIHTGMNECMVMLCGCVFSFLDWLTSLIDWLWTAQFPRRNLLISISGLVRVHNKWGGKAKVLSKNPSGTFISLKPRVRLEAIHHDRDQHNTLPAASRSLLSTARRSLTFSGHVWTLVTRRGWSLFFINTRVWAGIHLFDTNTWIPTNTFFFFQYLKPLIISVVKVNQKKLWAWQIMSELKHFIKLCTTEWSCRLRWSFSVGHLMRCDGKNKTWRSIKISKFSNVKQNSSFNIQP